MGRKLMRSFIVALLLVVFGVFAVILSPVFVASDATAASDTSSSNLRIFVHLQPEKPNVADGWFFEGDQVRVKLELYDIRKNPPEIRKNPDGTQDQKPPNEIIDWKQSGYKLLYVWDNLDTTRVVEYLEPFQPMEGEHFLFAYAVNSDGIYQTPATKFWMQFRLNKLNVAPTMSQVYVSPEYVSWGEGGPAFAKATAGEAGQITKEATSTSKVSLTTATSSANISIILKIQDFVKSFFSGRNSIWILLLVVGIVLLLGVKFLFRGENKLHEE